MSEFQSDRNGRYYKESDWRCLFDANTIKQIETSNMTSHVIDFTDHVDSLSCTYKDGTRYYNVLLSRIPTELEVYYEELHSTSRTIFCGANSA